MSLQPLKLDDLSWNDFVDGIRQRIIANSDGEWTLHSPTDPGVTLLEMFSWLFEQRIYWLDQVPDSLVRAILTLIGESIHTTQASRTVLRFELIPGNTNTVVERSKQLRAKSGDTKLQFTSQEELNLFPLSLLPNGAADINITVGELDRTIDLLANRSVEVLPADGEYAEMGLTLAMDRLLQANEAGKFLSLYFEFEVDEQIKPQWSHDSVDVKAPAKLDWYYSNTDTGQRKKFNVVDVIDGSQGFRRRGIIRLRVPDDWVPVENTMAAPFNYKLWVSSDKCTFSYPPRLKRIVPNVAIAEQYKIVELSWDEIKPQLQNWLKLPGQTLLLSQQENEPIESAIFVRFKESDEHWYEWQRTDDFYHHAPEDRVFIVDRERKQIQFGNGLNGRIPVLSHKDEVLARVCYLAGGGESVSFGANVSWITTDNDFTAINVVPAIDGKDTETLDQARARVAGGLQKRERAVTAADYEELVLSTPGIALARAHAAIGYNPNFPCHPFPGAVTVFVLPEVPRSELIQPSVTEIKTPQLDPGALVEINNRLHDRSLITTEVYVRGASYRAVKVIVELKGIFADVSRIKQLIKDHLKRYLDPLVGGESGDGWPFGGTLRPSSLMKQAQLLLSEGVIVEKVAIALDDESSFEGCRDVSINEHELVYLESFTLKVNNRSSSTGGLR